MMRLTEMRLRFRLRTLLLLPLIFAIGWYWMIWPEVTLDTFVDSMLQGRFTDARSMVDCVDCSIDFDWPTNEKTQLPDNTQQPVFRLSMFTRGVFACRRDTMDILLGRRVYFIPKYGQEIGYVLVVQRGTVTMLPKLSPIEKCGGAEWVRFIR